MNTAELISRLLDDLAAHGPREVRVVIRRSGTMPVVDIEAGPLQLYLLTRDHPSDDPTILGPRSRFTWDQQTGPVNQ